MAKKQQPPARRQPRRPISAPKVGAVEHIKDLAPDPDNARVHNPRNIGMIADALQEVGAARSIVIDEENTVLAGNGVVEGAAQAGITRVRVVEADGHEIIAVRRRGLTPEQKQRLALYDNRTGELSTWNPAAVAAAAQRAGVGIEKMFTPDELKALIASIPAQTTDGLTDPDEIPEPRKTSIKLGDMFELGQQAQCPHCQEWTDVPADEEVR